MSDSTDAELAAEGDHLAFERLYRRYLSRVYSLCTRLSGSPTKGAELTEDVFVRTWEALPQFTGETAFAPWLHRLATDVALNGRKVDETTATMDQGGSATERWNDSESTSHDVERLDLSQAIDRLPAGMRRIFVLHDVEGYTHEDLAEIFGITVGGSKARLQRARVLLKEALGR
jgi:RNA polymerase sigma-70 factor (ECF subfamily)